MLPEQPQIIRDDCLLLIDRALAQWSSEAPYMCGSIPFAALEEDPPESVHSSLRLSVQLEGRRHCAISIRGRREDVVLEPGDCVCWAPHARAIQWMEGLGSGLGIVLLPQSVRIISARYQGAQPPAYSPPAYHTTAPLGGAGLHVIRALNYLAEQSKRDLAGRDLVVALLRMVRDHVVEDASASHSHGRAEQTWRTVRAYLDENFASPMNRESVAEMLGFHPNYLSALARQMGGQSFHEVLEDIRMDHARHLLQETPLKLAQIAKLCGYNDTSYFANSFRRAIGITPGRFRRESGSSQ